MLNIEIRPSFDRRGLTVLLSKAVFALAFGLLAFHFYQAGQVHFFFGCLAFGFFILLILQVAWPISKPILVINEQGIWDRRSGFGLILWQDILDVQVEVHGPFLCVRVKNPEFYIARLSPQRKANLEFHQSLGFRMLNLEVRGLRVDLLGLLELLRDHIAFHRRHYSEAE
ncbi:MAG: STM3941 family protein [Pseudobdellovibrionaceae bacterium]